MDNNMNNSSSKEQTRNGEKGGYKKKNHFNKNKKRFDKGSNGSEQVRGTDKKNEKRQGESGHKNSDYKNNGEHRYKGKGDKHKRFDYKKKHRDYKRSDNEIDLVKAQRMGIDLETDIPNTDAVSQDDINENLDAKTTSEVISKEEVIKERTFKEEDCVQETQIMNEPKEEFVTEVVKEEILESGTNKKELPNKIDILVNDFNIEKDYGTYKQSDKIKRQDVAAPKKMIEVIGVRFRKAGKIYYFSRGKYEVDTNQHVIVETARGIEYGRVVLSPRMVEDKPIYHPLKSIIRVANANDDKVEAENRKKEKDAYNICLEKIKNHKLDMKLVDCEYTFDNNKVLFYFTADGRIDFRELVKDLAAVFRTRIELRQIGVRDETKIVGGIGTCGRPLCCHTYLSDFAPVSIKMAKEQNLSLNPTKISGVCGRLMCCLINEEAWYEEANLKLPYIGDHVETVDGFHGEVHSVNVVKQIVRVIIHLENDEREAREYPVDDLRFERRKRYDKVAIDDELRKLEMLEKHDIKSNLEDE